MDATTAGIPVEPLTWKVTMLNTLGQAIKPELVTTLIDNVTQSMLQALGRRRADADPEHINKLQESVDKKCAEWREGVEKQSGRPSIR